MGIARGKDSHPKGFTLTEILIVVTIILVLLGILLPTLVSARRRGMLADDLTKMRQVALAGTMYDDQFGDFPISIKELVDSDIVKRDMVRLSLDSAPNGLGNFVATEIERSKDTWVPYSQSFVTLGTFGYSHAYSAGEARAILSQSAAGWAFADLDLQRPLSEPVLMWGEHYYRLGVDGSVMPRTIRRSLTKVGNQITSMGIKNKLFFVEETP